MTNNLELLEINHDEYKESHNFILSEDAIMDEDVFTHLKRVISYLYKNSEPDSSRNEDELLKKLNMEVLNTIVDGYIGYSWMCEACASWIADATSDPNELKADTLNFNIKEYFKRRKTSSDQIPTDNIKNKISNKSKALNILYDSLASLLTKKYDTDIMRDYMDNQKDLKSWNPPLSYWQLMQSPSSVSHMIKLYRDRPKDAFLSAWYQDYTNTHSHPGNTEESQLTSNFSVYTLRLSEEIRKFLLEDDIAEVDPLESGSISNLFLHAENAYIYTQALLHFIYQWRVDLKGCRRLSQLISMSILYPQGGTSTNYSNMEHSASQINLLMTNFTKFQRLYRLFRQLSHSLNRTNSILDMKDVCEFGDELQKTLDKFESYEILLFEKEVSTTTRCTTSADIDDPSNYTPDIIEEFEDPSVSQCGGYGDPSSDYKRLRDAPEMPPLEAIRESTFLECLINNFADPSISLAAEQAWIKYANLLVLLSVPSPYELLYQAYEEHLNERIKHTRRGHTWQNFDLESQPSDASPESQPESPDLLDCDDLSSPFGSSVLESIEDGNSRAENYVETPFGQIVNDTTNYVNTAQTTIESEIYKNPNHNKKLGTLNNLDPSKVIEMKELFKEFKETSLRHKGIARKELFEIYRITHDPLKSPIQIQRHLLNHCTTNIASSAILSYISCTLSNSSSGEGLTPLGVLLLKTIADSHSVKRKPILGLIRKHAAKIFQCVKSRSSVEILELVTDFLVYLVRFDSLYPAVITTLLDIVQYMDKVYIRRFIASIISFCAPPYKKEFVLPFLDLILKSGIIISGEREQSFSAQIIEFIDDCNECRKVPHINEMVRQVEQIVQGNI